MVKFKFRCIFLYTYRFSLMHTFCTLLCPSDNQPITELFRQSLISNSVLHYNKQSFMFSSAWIGVIFWQRMGGQLHKQQWPAYFIYDSLSELNGSKSEPIIGSIFWYWKRVLLLTHIQQDLNVNNYYSNKAAFIQTRSTTSKIHSVSHSMSAGSTLYSNIIIHH